MTLPGWMTYPDRNGAMTLSHWYVSINDGAVPMYLTACGRWTPAYDPLTPDDGAVLRCRSCADHEVRMRVVWNEAACVPRP